MVLLVSFAHTQEDKICLDSHELLDEPVQEEIMSRKKVLAGHFIWGELLFLVHRCSGCHVFPPLVLVFLYLDVMRVFFFSAATFLSAT